MKFELFQIITVIDEKFLVLFNLLREPDNTFGVGSRPEGSRFKRATDRKSDIRKKRHIYYVKRATSS